MPDPSRPPTTAVYYREHRPVPRVWCEYPKDSGIPTGFYIPIGGICFPLVWPHCGYLGMAMLGLLATKPPFLTYIVEQIPWVTVTPPKLNEGATPQPALTPNVMMLWARYYADRYYSPDITEHDRELRRRLYASEEIPPKLSIAPLTIHADKDSYMSSIWDHDASGRLVYPAASPLVDAMERWQAEGAIDPALAALGCILVGVNRMTRELADLQAAKE